MSLPELVEKIIKDYLKQNRVGPMQLVRRKGDQEEQLENIYTGQRIMRDPSGNVDTQGQTYDLLPEGDGKEELMKFWNDFHSHAEYLDFTAFYSKRSFCTLSSKAESPLQTINEEDFVSLLADRKFLFLEDNEHGSNPEYPPLFEIMRNPKRYLSSEDSPERTGTEHEADKRMRENAKIVFGQGLVPTVAHARAYKEMKHNADAIHIALQQRRDFIRRGSNFFKDGIPSFQPFTIQILPKKDRPNEVEENLSQLFHDFLYAACHKAYVKKYDKFLNDAKDESLAAIESVTQHLNEHPDISVSKALVIWRLFTNETKKLATGQLNTFKFAQSKVRSGLRLTNKTQAPTYQKIHCHNMLFDYLLKILPPEKDGNGAELAYAKFQYHMFTGYNGYTHFRTSNIDLNSLVCDSNTKCKYAFDLIPDSTDCTDHFGGIIRHHILCCISNDVRWLTPGLPNDWNINSSILATLLLQDSAYFPKTRRLTNRIHAFLNGSKGKKCIKDYLQFNGGQSELIERLTRWCNDNDLIFEGDIPSSDMTISDDKMKALCSRLVLEYMLKERALQEVRQNLATVAHKLWGDILITGYETFSLEESD